MNAVVITVTDAGAELAARLPHRHRHGGVMAAVAEEWPKVDGLILVCATGIAVRAIAPHLDDKRTDPAVVVVDDAGRYAIALSGGHTGGANALATDVADLLGAEVVITTATDARQAPALDQLPGFTASGDVAGVTRDWLDGAPPAVVDELGWPLPSALAALGPEGSTKVVVTDRAVAPAAGVAVLHPPALVVGVGASTGAPADAAVALIGPALASAGLDPAAVGMVATIDRRASDPVVTALGWPVRSYTATELAPVPVPHPSEVVAAEVGTPSVAEAAALLAAGPGGELVVSKIKGTTATVAVARRRRPAGRVTVVGLGPGGAEHRTPAATAAVRRAQVLIGYTVYVDQCRHLVGPGTEVVDSPIGAEVDRCEEALRRAAGGAEVALVCSGDPGVFAMATLVLERAPALGSPTVEVVPGVTASLAAAAVLGAPLAHDHALISLSDLLTPWPVIERRLRAAADADLVVALYNPRSKKRTEHLPAALGILAEHRPPSTPVGVVTNATRPDQAILVTSLEELSPEEAGMFSVVIVGNTTTTIIDGRLVTPRGYGT